MTGRAAADPELPPFEPARICQIEIGDGPTGIAARDGRTGREYRAARVLVRLHGQPIGLVGLRLDPGGMSPQATYEAIRRELAPEIAAHLRSDATLAATGPTLRSPAPVGSRDADQARCIEERERGGRALSATVVITTRDRTTQLEASLASVLAMRHPGFDVIVVDNVPSDDSTAAMIRSSFGGHTSLTYLRENRPGISAARNAGIRRARGEVVAFTDDDVEVDPDWLSQLVAGFSAADRVGVVTGLTLPAAIESPVHGWFEEFGGFGKGFDQRLFDLGPNRPGDDPLFPYAPGRLGTGNNMAFRAHVLRAIGSFDACLGVGSPTHSGEDLAAFIKALWAGWTLVYRPTALVSHHHRDTYQELRRQVYGYGVGLSACMVSCLSEEPSRIPGFVSRLPRGLSYLLDPRSAKNERRTHGYPRRLALAEAIGLLYGPFAYARARRRSVTRQIDSTGTPGDARRGPRA